jgi:hypothetical protein
MDVTWDVTILSCEHDIVLRRSQRATTLEAVLKNRVCNLVAAGWPSLAETQGLRVCASSRQSVSLTLVWKLDIRLASLPQPTGPGRLGCRGR